MEGWISLLSASYVLGMSKLRDQAIKNIEKSSTVLEPVRKILLARKYDVPSWITTSLESLCCRSSPIDVVEARLLDLETTVKLFTAREMANAERSKNMFGPVGIEVIVAKAISVMFPKPENSPTSHSQDASIAEVPPSVPDCLESYTATCGSSNSFGAQGTPSFDVMDETFRDEEDVSCSVVRVNGEPKELPTRRQVFGNSKKKRTKTASDYLSSGARSGGLVEL